MMHRFTGARRAIWISGIQLSCQMLPGTSALIRVAILLTCRWSPAIAFSYRIRWRQRGERSSTLGVE
jgi:hypothetical protein